MRDPRLETGTPDCGGPGFSRKTEIACAFWVAFSRRSVNLFSLLFRFLPLAGLGLAGGWADRLVIWCPLLDMAAKVLRAVAESHV